MNIEQYIDIFCDEDKKKENLLIQQLINFNANIKYNKNTILKDVFDDIETFKNMLNFEANEALKNNNCSLYKNKDGTIIFISYDNQLKQKYDLNTLLFLYSCNYSHLTKFIIERKKIKDISLKIMKKIRNYLYKINSDDVYIYNIKY